MKKKLFNNFKYLLLLIAVFVVGGKSLYADYSSVNKVLYGTFKWDSLGPAGNATGVWANGPTILPATIMSNKVSYTTFRFNDFAFSFNSPVTGTGSSYTIDVQFTLQGNINQNFYNASSFGYLVQFEQGTIDQQVKNISVISSTKNSVTIRLTESVTLKSSTSLSTIVVSIVNTPLLYCNNNVEICPDTVTISIKDLKANVTISEDPTLSLIEGLGSSINNVTNEINNTNTKIDNLNDTIDKNFNSCSSNIFNAKNWKSNSFASSSVSNNNFHGNGNSWATALYSFENLEDSTYTLYYNSSVASGVMYYSTTSSTDNNSFKYLMPEKYHHISVKDKLYIRLQVTSKTQVDFTKLMLVKGSVNSFIDFGNDLCINKIDKTNDKLDDLNSNITDSSLPDTSSLENVAGWLPAGPVDSILTLPLVVLNKISDVLSGTCSPIVLPLPFVNSSIELPCGTTFYSGITGLNAFLISLGLIIGSYILYCYFVYLYNWVDKKVSMVESDREKWGVN